MSEQRLIYALKILVEILSERKMTIVKKFLKKIERLIRLIARATNLWQLELLLVPFIHFRQSSFEPEVEKRIKERLKNGWTFIDVGASTGYYTILAAMIVGPTGCVVSVEPVQRESTILYYTTKFYQLRNVIMVRVSAYSRNGRAKLYLSPIDGLHSLRWGDGRCMASVYTLTLDSIISQLDVHGPVFIKVDVEGAEVEVIKGAKNALSSVRPLCIVVEAHGKELRNTVVQRLKAFGFIPELLDGQHIYAESRH